MTLLLTIVHIVVCLILIVVILIQGGRGQGLSGPSFASGNVQSLFGTQAADFLTKATTVSAICFLLTCLSLNIVESHKSKSLLAGTRQGGPVDVEAIKKALAKVAAEKSPAGDKAKAAVNDIAKTAEATAKTAAKSTQEAAQKTPAALASAIPPAPSAKKS